jgi:hypothetical protein
MQRAVRAVTAREWENSWGPASAGPLRPSAPSGHRAGVATPQTSAGRAPSQIAVISSAAR